MKNAISKGILMVNLFIIYELTYINAQYSVNQNKIDAIIQLAKFVDWSQNCTFSDTKRTLYIITNKEDIASLNNKSLSNAAYKNWQIKYCNNLNQVTNGSVIFITKDQKNFTKKVINYSTNNDIITISDNLESFCREGGMINIFDEENTVKFEINYRVIQNKSLEISSKVLALAKIYD